jgi:hypothetical protein
MVILIKLSVSLRACADASRRSLQRRFQRPFQRRLDAFFVALSVLCRQVAQVLRIAEFPKRYKLLKRRQTVQKNMR